jgi:hypothetical protein
MRRVDSLMSRAAGSAAAEEGEWAAPEWVLDVPAVTEARVRSGAVAERVAVEGVMLQVGAGCKWVAAATEPITHVLLQAGLTTNHQPTNQYNQPTN